MSPVGFTPGFSDFFDRLAKAGDFVDQATADALFIRAKNDFNARTLRFTVFWNEVDTINAQGQRVISYEKYNPLIWQAYWRGLKLLPVVWSAPVWMTDRVPTPGGNIYYPPESRLSEFGTFVADTLSYFAQFGVCRAVEVCNEPNLPKWKIPSEHYKLMLYAVLEAVIAKSYPFQPTYEPTVISGGMSCDDAGAWKTYLAEILNQCPPTSPSGEFFLPAVGIHPYNTKAYSNKTQDEAIADFVQVVKDKWNDAAGIATAGDIWITEFGCTANAPFGETGKRNALEQLVGVNGYFASRSRCKAVLLYRYLPQSLAPDDTVNLPNWKYWDSVPMLGDDLLGKQPVADMLKSNWLNAPS